MIIFDIYLFESNWKSLLDLSFISLLLNNSDVEFSLSIGSLRLFKILSDEELEEDYESFEFPDDENEFESLERLDSESVNLNSFMRDFVFWCLIDFRVEAFEIEVAKDFVSDLFKLAGTALGF